MSTRYHKPEHQANMERLKDPCDTRFLPDVKKLDGKKVTFLLGTDRHIEEGTPGQETRVGITPAQAYELKVWLEKLGIVLTLYVIKDAGAAAGFNNEDYEEAGAQLVDEVQLPNLFPLPDVVHALKEPSPYECSIPGRPIRLGALHTGKFDSTSGLACLLKQRNFAGILDGSAIGGYAYKINGGYQIPIRSSMSFFAGLIAADMVAERVKAHGRGKVVISGGGVVGLSTAMRLFQKYRNCSAEILLVEAREERCNELRRSFNDSLVRIKQGSAVGQDLHEVVGLILAAFSPGVPAPKVVDIQSLQHLKNDSIIVDVSVDEGGSIEHPEGETVREAIGKLRNGITYIGDPHLPKKFPHQASQAHGKAVLPYLAVLLYLSAREGGPSQAVDHIMRQDCSDTPDYFKALVYDLKTGLAFRGPVPISVMEHVVKDKQKVTRYLTQQGIPFVVQ